MPVADVRRPIIETLRNLHVRNIREMTESSTYYTLTRQHRSLVLFIGYCAMSSYDLQTQMAGGYCDRLSKEVGAFQKCVIPKATAHLWDSWDSLSLAQQSKTRKEKTLMERIGERDK